MKKAAEFYIRNIKIIGALYCAIPATIYLVLSFIIVPFRSVYAIRFGITITIGCVIGAYLNYYVVQLWLLKHKSTSGPATIRDGATLGSLIGLGQSIIPASTLLIGTNHIEFAKLAIIVTSIVCSLIGLLFGSFLSVIGKKYI